jgi:tetratricopeptide (TPR) repeat protein
MRHFMRLATILFSLGLSSAAYGVCPPLAPFQNTEEDAWESTRQSLAEIFDQCLLSSEYFSLLGAAQLNTGRLVDAMESLERALLLDPDNGAALIDYSEALLEDGQLFAAIEVNQLLLARTDAPPGLKQQIESRQREWSALTRQTDWQIDLLGGYDSNLNGAPDAETVALTLSGEPILLKLNETYQAIEGPYLNARVAALHSRLGPEHQDTLFGQVRGRWSDDSSSDVKQFSGRYTRRGSPLPEIGQLSVGLNHLVFLGNSLFTGTDASYRGGLATIGTCSTNLSAALQQQRWQQQRRLDGIEMKAGVEASCPLGTTIGQEITLGASLLNNLALNDNRLGGNRDGWQATAGWRAASSQRVITAQVNFTSILDGRGFSSLLENNARRRVQRGSVLIQYRERLEFLARGLELVANLYHQDQRSNIGLFDTIDTSIEVGLSWRF